MSCESPLFISNRNLFYEPVSDKVYNAVPCGQCQSCREQKQRDWYLRLYYHYLQFQNCGGRVAFITLTFNNQNLPLLTFRGKMYPCFSKDIIDRYINSLRKWFERQGVTGVDYFFAPEFGGKHGRPHYHANIFIPNCAITDGQIRKALRRYWIYGYSYFCSSEKGGAFLHNHHNLKYVSKYVTKDFSFFDKEYIKEYIDECKQENGGKLPLEIRHQLPYHTQSKMFGNYLTEFIKRGDTLKLLVDGIRLPYDDFFYSIPQYIKDKFIYKPIKCVYDDKDGERHFVRVKSPFAKDYAFARFDKLVSDKTADLEHKISFLGLSSALPSPQYWNDNFAEKYGFKIDTFQDLRDTIQSYITDNNISLQDAVVADFIYRGRRHTNLDPYSVLDHQNCLKWIDDKYYYPLHKDKQRLAVEQASMSNQYFCEHYHLIDMVNDIYNDYRKRKSFARAYDNSKKTDIIHKFYMI